MNVAELQEIVRAGDGPLLPVGHRTKPALSTSAHAAALDVSGLTGILEYDPAELTVTALAGTPVAELQSVLAEHGQYLPCDLPFTAAGATLGGAVAAGASGPCTLRYGGLRDFIIGVHFINGDGALITGGGKVVKNAAGFDLPKLMVGSIGRLGVITQLSFKVFPAPPATTTLEYAVSGAAAGLERMAELLNGPVELDALDLSDGRVLARVGGRADILERRLDRLPAPDRRHDGDPERALWHEAAEFTWASPDATLVRVGLSRRHLVALDVALAGQAVRYSLGGTVAWVAVAAEQSLDALDAGLAAVMASGTVLRGPADHPLLGHRSGGAFADRVTHALDPHARFLEV